MPNFEEHCESTLKKLGCRFEKVHRWMDELSHVMGSDHRIRRHDPFKTPDVATQIFCKDYPNHSYLIGEAVLDHVMLDAKSGQITKTVSETEQILLELEEQEQKESFTKSLEMERRVKSLKATPIWLGLSIGSILSTYVSCQNDPTHSSPLIAIFFLASCLFLWITLEHIGEYLGFSPITFSFLTFMEIGVIIFCFAFSPINEISLSVFGFFTGFYLLMTVGEKILRKMIERDTKRRRTELRETLEQRKREDSG